MPAWQFRDGKQSIQERLLSSMPQVLEPDCPHPKNFCSTSRKNRQKPSFRPKQRWMICRCSLCQQCLFQCIQNPHKQNDSMAQHGLDFPQEKPTTDSIALWKESLNSKRTQQGSKSVQSHSMHSLTKLHWCRYLLGQ